jgi:hypothetical protein
MIIEAEKSDNQFGRRNRNATLSGSHTSLFPGTIGANRGRHSGNQLKGRNLVKSRHSHFSPDVEKRRLLAARRRRTAMVGLMSTLLRQILPILPRSL